MLFMRFVVILCCLLSIQVANADLRSPWEFYKERFLSYLQEFDIKLQDDFEFLDRLKIFVHNVDIIERHNSDPTATFQMGLNPFSHLTFKEFLDMVSMGATRPPGVGVFPSSKSIHTGNSVNMEQLPNAVDWVQAGAVTHMKNQGRCGSCWAFSATGAMEGAYFIKQGNLTSFSEQQLVSCAPSPNEGCNGGWMEDAFKWATANGGLASGEDYPYTSGNSGKSAECESGHPPVPFSAPKGYSSVQPKDVKALMSAVSQQPISIAIQADQLAFQFYRRGIITGRCGQNLDHGVLLVGYGQEGGLDFWKVKNSWGDKWGEDGYVRIERSSANKCGVLEAPSYPTY